MLNPFFSISFFYGVYFTRLLVMLSETPYSFIHCIFKFTVWMACRISVPQLGIKTTPLAVEAGSPDCGTTSCRHKHSVERTPTASAKCDKGKAGSMRSACHGLVFSVPSTPLKHHFLIGKRVLTNVITSSCYIRSHFPCPSGFILFKKYIYFCISWIIERIKINYLSLVS